jgi:hypothetical protein
MKKWVVPILSVLLVFVLIYLSVPSNSFKVTVSKGDRGRDARITLAQNTEKEDSGADWTRLLKEIQEKLNTWLKSINERIDSQDVSRIEVRFLEVLRNILEWVKEKIDAKIEGSKGKPVKKKGRLEEI